ncbi:putative HVA22-like protein g [Momordica charantia]|uniref:HVA22-like protein n=1 Tax=Momordica charantia TaxID=3673 RepID=A0A6J1C2L3_MOMCH|nr:putative HVA22-like protein g [Momordica charantia]
MKEGLEVMGSFISRTLLMAFGYVYPAYECYKIVERSSLEIFQLLFWCHYWIIVALLTVFERMGDPLISWLPLYNEAKLAFFIYLWHPKTKGTACMFRFVLRPFIAKHEAEIDHYLFELRLKAAEVAALFWHKTTSCSQTTIIDLLHNISSLPASQTRSKKNHKKDETELAAKATEPVSTMENRVTDDAEKNHKKDETELAAKATEPVSTMENRVTDDAEKVSSDEQSSKPKCQKWRFSDLFCAK